MVRTEGVYLPKFVFLDLLFPTLSTISRSSIAIFGVGRIFRYSGNCTKILNVLKNSEELACVLWDCVHIILILPVYWAHM